MRAYNEIISATANFAKRLCVYREIESILFVEILSNVSNENNKEKV